MTQNTVTPMQFLEVNSQADICTLVMILVITGIPIRATHLYIPFSDGMVCCLDTRRVFTRDELSIHDTKAHILSETDDVIQVWIDEFNKINGDTAIVSRLPVCNK